MALFIRFIDSVTETVLFDLPVKQATLDVGLNQSTRWSATIPADVLNISLLYTGVTVEWYVDGDLIFEGVLQEFSPQIENITELALSGRSFLDNLYAFKSYRLSYYSDKPTLGILTELLLHANWTLGDIGTLEDVDQTTTIDLRSEKTLLTQLNQAITSVPFSYWREGEKRLGRRTLDVGLFQKKSNILALMPGKAVEFANDDEYVHTIDSLSYQINFVDALYAVSVEGGNVIPSAGVERIVNLGDALTDDPTRRLDPDFPIIEDLNEKVWTVVNTRDYPFPGGVLQSTDATLSNLVTVNAIGDITAGAVEANVHSLMTFIPYPGLLDHITIRLGARDASFTTELGVNFNVYWRIYEIDPTDNRTVVAIIHHQVLDAATFPAANMALRLEPNTEVIMQSGKLYGLGVGLTAGPSADVVRQNIVIGNRTSTSNSFFARTLNIPGGTMPVVGSGFSLANTVPVMEVVTNPIGVIFAGSTLEKQDRFAPPKTGGVSVASEIQKAGEALYFYGINLLLEHPAQKREYSLNAVGSKRLPKPGDTIYVKGTSKVEFFDAIRGTVAIEVVEDIDTDLRISNYTVNFQGNDIKLSYKLLDDRGVAVTERLLALYDETKERKPPEGDIWTSPWNLLLDTINVTISDVMPNAVFEDGTLAYEVTVDIHDGTVPSLPTATEGVYLAGNPYGVSASGELRIEVTVEPEFVASSPIVFLVGFQNRGWEYGDSADLTVKLVWR